MVFRRPGSPGRHAWLLATILCALSCPRLGLAEDRTAWPMPATATTVNDTGTITYAWEREGASMDVLRFYGPVLLKDGTPDPAPAVDAIGDWQDGGADGTFGARVRRFSEWRKTAQGFHFDSLRKLPFAKLSPRTQALLTMQHGDTWGKAFFRDWANRLLRENDTIWEFTSATYVQDSTQAPGDIAELRKQIAWHQGHLRPADKRDSRAPTHIHMAFRRPVFATDEEAHLWGQRIAGLTNLLNTYATFQSCVNVDYGEYTGPLTAGDYQGLAEALANTPLNVEEFQLDANNSGGPYKFGMVGLRGPGLMGRISRNVYGNAEVIGFEFRSQLIPIRVIDRVRSLLASWKTWNTADDSTTISLGDGKPYPVAALYHAPTIPELPITARDSTPSAWEFGARPQGIAGPPLTPAYTFGSPIDNTLWWLADRATHTPWAYVDRWTFGPRIPRARHRLMTRLTWPLVQWEQHPAVAANAQPDIGKRLQSLRDAFISEVAIPELTNRAEREAGLPNRNADNERALVRAAVVRFCNNAKLLQYF